MGNTLQQLGSAIALSVALAGAPNTASAQVSEATRAKVMELQKDPAFKLKGSAKKCMSGELVDPLCESLVKGQVDGFQSNQELLALQAEKSRLDAEKSRLDAEKSRLDAEKSRLDAEKSRLDNSLALMRNEGKIGTHVGSAIYLLELINTALFNMPESNIRTAYKKDGYVTPDVADYIERVLQKIDKKQSLSKADILEFNTLFQKHTEIAKKMIAETKEWKDRTIIEYLDRTLISYSTLKPKIDAKIG